MRLNKKRLLKFVRTVMINLGYIEFEDNQVSDANLFVKPQGELFLTIGFTIHRYYNDAFTLDYYLSRTTNYGAGWGDIPHNKIRVRPGELMSAQERLAITVDADCKINPEITDMWWNAFDIEGNPDATSLESLQKTIQLTESRVIGQPEVIDKIYASQVLEEQFNIINEVILIAQLEDWIDSLEFLPTRELKGTPLKWFKAAETALKRRNDADICKNSVRWYAKDAARVFYMRTIETERANK